LKASSASPNQLEAIADEVDYEDISFLNWLFRRKTGLTPAQYRLRFGQLSKLVAS
jgi:AraC-like DNA-binding protein